MSDPQRDRLAELFLKLFNQDELRRLLRYKYPALADELTSPASLKQNADEAVALLFRDRLVDDRLFDALREQRPRRADDIDAVARELRAAPPPEPQAKDMSRTTWLSRHEALVALVVTVTLLVALIALLAS